jgi:hypothetical protein
MTDYERGLEDAAKLAEESRDYCRERYLEYKADNMPGIAAMMTGAALECDSLADKIRALKAAPEQEQA